MKNQTIIIKRKKNCFVQIDNNIFSDNRLTFKAKGILAYFLSKPKTWEANVQDLYKHTTEGYASIRSGITELILTGYMELKTEYDNKSSSFKGRKYFIYEEPLFRSGWRRIKDKNKNFCSHNTIVQDNPLGNRKKIKVKNNDND